MISAAMLYVLLFIGVNVVFKLIRKRARKKNSMTFDVLPVARNVSYSSHCVRNAVVAHGAQEGDYELIDSLPYQPYANVQPTTST